MEVHHHSHPAPAGPGAGHKKWTHYLWEFLMLFLAVFCGFLVENFREHRVEEERLEKHMHTMVENLKYDTTRYSRNLVINVRMMDELDSFRVQIAEAIDGRPNNNKLYYYYWKCARNFGVPIYNDAAISQLKSSGMIRLIRNDALVAEMGDYYGRLHTNLERGRENVSERADRLTVTYRDIFSLRGFDKLIHPDSIWTPSTVMMNEQYLSAILTRDPSLKLLPGATEKLEQLYTDVADLEWMLGIYNGMINAYHKAADSLVAHIREEYD
jgi:hypothetical protein